MITALVLPLYIAWIMSTICFLIKIWKYLASIGPYVFWIKNWNLSGQRRTTCFVIHGLFYAECVGSQFGAGLKLKEKDWSGL